MEDIGEDIVSQNTSSLAREREPNQVRQPSTMGPMWRTSSENLSSDSHWPAIYPISRRVWRKSRATQSSHIPWRAKGHDLHGASFSRSSLNARVCQTRRDVETSILRVGNKIHQEASNYLYEEHCNVALLVRPVS